MRAGSLAVVVREEKPLRQAGSRNHHWVERRGPKTVESYLPAPQQGLWGWEVLQGGHRKGKQGVSLCVADPRPRQRCPHLLCPSGGGGDCHDISAAELRVVGGEWEEGGGRK